MTLEERVRLQLTLEMAQALLESAVQMMGMDDAADDPPEADPMTHQEIMEATRAAMSAEGRSGEPGTDAASASGGHRSPEPAASEEAPVDMSNPLARMRWAQGRPPA